MIIANLALWKPLCENPQYVGLHHRESFVGIEFPQPSPEYRAPAFRRNFHPPNLSVRKKISMGGLRGGEK